MMKKSFLPAVFLVLSCWFLAGCAGSDSAAEVPAAQLEGESPGDGAGEVTEMAGGASEVAEGFFEAAEDSSDAEEMLEKTDGDAEFSDNAQEAREDGETMKMQVTDGKHAVTFELNDSNAARSLYGQLPLTIDVENYSNDEKIFYPEKLDVTDPVDADAKKGDLAYFSPWGDVVMYYRDAGPYPGLYALGRATSGADEIESLSGTLEITKE